MQLFFLCCTTILVHSNSKIIGVILNTLIFNVYCLFFLQFLCATKLGGLREINSFLKSPVILSKHGHYLSFSKIKWQELVRCSML